MCDDRHITLEVFLITVINSSGFQRNVYLYHEKALRCTHTHTHRHTHRNTVIPNAVILALQVVVAAVDEMAEEPSVDGLCELISVLL